MGGPRKVHGRSTEGPWEVHGRSTRCPWEVYGRSMGGLREVHGRFKGGLRDVVGLLVYCPTTPQIPGVLAFSYVEKYLIYYYYFMKEPSVASLNVCSCCKKYTV